MSAELNKVRKFHVPDEEEDALINAGIAADEDTYELSSEEFKNIKRGRGRPKATARKVAISIRLDDDVASYFKSQGAGWQTRVNEVLKQYADKHR
jgi:uncharacterized protein (DUF4415 family)